MNGSMVKNHISLKTVFEFSAIRRTSFPSWFQACQRVRPPVLISQLQGHLQDRRVIVLHLLQARLRHPRQHQVIMRLEKERIELKVTPLQYLCQLMLTDRTGQPVVNQANKIPKPHKKEPKIERGSPLCSDIPEWLQNSGKIWWMMKFLIAETHTPVLLMKYLQSPHSRDVRTWVSTMFVLISLKTEIARSVRGPKLQEPRAEDAMEEPYLVPKILVT